MHKTENPFCLNSVFLGEGKAQIETVLFRVELCFAGFEGKIIKSIYFPFPRIM